MWGFRVAWFPALLVNLSFLRSPADGNGRAPAPFLPELPGPPWPAPPGAWPTSPEARRAVPAAAELGVPAASARPPQFP